MVGMQEGEQRTPYKLSISNHWTIHFHL